VRSLGTWLVPDLIRSFKAVEPGVEFQLYLGLSEQVADQLLRGDVDLILTGPRLVGAGLGVAVLPALHQPAAPGAPATLAIAARDATRPVGLAWIAGRQLPGLAEAFRTWLISSAPWRR
jgi:LysR family transcriptional regulator, transcription activator of glutamate synthase operon